MNQHEIVKDSLKTLVWSISDGIITIDSKGIIEAANSMVAQLFGYTTEEIHGKNVSFLMPNDHSLKQGNYLSEYLISENSKIIGKGREVYGLRKDGSQFPFLLSINELVLNNEKKFIGIVRDLSEIRRTEEALKESGLRLSSIIETAVDGIITISKKGIVESMNSAAVRLFGYQKEEVIGNNIKMLMPEPHRRKHDGYLKHHQKTREKRIIGIGREVEGKRKDGTLFPFRLSVSEVKLTDSIIYTGIIHDLSEEKKAQQSLNELNQQLEEKIKERTSELTKIVTELEHSNKNLENEIKQRKKAKNDLKAALKQEVELGELKSRFVSMASHEFRTPLTCILSSVSLIERYKNLESEDKRQKHIKRIKSSVKNLTNILNDFLSLDKLQSGMINCDPAEFNILDFFEGLMEDVEELKKPGQEIIHKHHGDKIVYLDEYILMNIIINLLSNAIKYSDENKKVYIETQIEDDLIKISIKDQGIGIPKDDIKHMFSRFFRASNSSAIQGTGLGLNIVKRYLSLMNGQIELESKENVGSTFKVTLPQRLDQKQLK